MDSTKDMPSAEELKRLYAQLGELWKRAANDPEAYDRVRRVAQAVIAGDRTGDADGCRYQVIWVPRGHQSVMTGDRVRITTPEGEVIEGIATEPPRYLEQEQKFLYYLEIDLANPAHGVWETIIETPLVAQLRPLPPQKKRPPRSAPKSKEQWVAASPHDLEIGQRVQLCHRKGVSEGIVVKQPVPPDQSLLGAWTYKLRVKGGKIENIRTGYDPFICLGD